jgi:hypothetical protein
MAVWFQQCLLFFLALGLVFGYGSPAKADKDAELKAIIRAWKKRQQETTSFRFEWIEKIFTPKEQLPVPAKEDAMYQKKAGVIVSGSRMATFSEGPMWVQDRFVPTLDRAAFDGTSSKSLHVQVPEQVHPIGNINSIQRNENAGSNVCIAILLAYRAFHPEMGRFEENKMQVADEKSILRNKKCICVEQNKGTYTARCWVDPSRDFVIIRYAMVFDGFPDFQCDVEYKLDNQLGWIPETWHDVLMSTNSKPVRLWTDRTVHVTTCMINGPVEDQEFQLEFPPGTDGMDWINNQKFIVLNDGSKRVITNAEIKRGITYEELLQSEGKTWRRNLVTAVGIAGLGMALGLLVLWARKRRREPA